MDASNRLHKLALALRVLTRPGLVAKVLAVAAFISIGIV